MQSPVKVPISSSLVDAVVKRWIDVGNDDSDGRQASSCRF